MRGMVVAGGRGGDWYCRCSGNNVHLHPKTRRCWNDEAGGAGGGDGAVTREVGSRTVASSACQDHGIENKEAM